MCCFHPRNAWYSRRLNPSGKRSIVFSESRGLSGSYFQVPCGRCDGCLSDRAMEWSIRIFHEASRHERSSFLTLTYSPEACPGVLVKRHLQNFFRSLRDSGESLRYFACGEYGSQTRRPHYHAIVFGQDFLGDAVPINDQLFTSPHLERHWPHGFVSAGDFTMGAACYVAGYMQKKVGDPDCFHLMSRRPGIGHDWLDCYLDDIARTGVVTIEGKELPCPRRYLSWAGDQLSHVVEERRLKASSLSLEQQMFRSTHLVNKERAFKASRSLRSDPL